MMEPVFHRLGFETTVEVDVSFKKQILDLVVVTRSGDPVTFQNLKAEYYRGMENLNDHNLFTFKSFRESFNVAALQELYGHLTNYKKIRKIKETDSDKVNLYAVTHHYPKSLLAPVENTEFLKCVVEGEIYDLSFPSPLRIIVTRDSNHPIFGLFSNNPQRIMSCRKKLQEDRELFDEVSNYLNKLYDFYNLEGVGMAYTKDMFIRDYYPEWWQRIEESENKLRESEKKASESEKKARRDVVAKLLKAKFGVLGPEHRQALEEASLPELDRMAIRILTATEIKEVLVDHG